MVRIEISKVMGHPRARVWEALANLESHVAWMKDAVSLTFTSESRRGPGTEMRVTTAVGPVRTVDLLRVTGWNEGESIDVEHLGLVRGQGRLKVLGDEDGSVVSWTEDLRFPWRLGGPVTAVFARPILAAIWKGNLNRLDESL